VEYKVRWKDYGEDEDQWFAEELFDELKIVNEFNERMNSKTVSNTARQENKGNKR